MISCAILCGGQSRRMGTDKAGLLWGREKLVDMIAKELSELGDVFLSTSRENLARAGAHPAVVDAYPDCGPLGGLCTALSACKTPLLLTVSCDMPFVTARLGAALASRLTDDVQAVVPREASGRMHPLCAVYRRDTLSPFLDQLRTGNYRMRDALRQIRTLYVPAQTLPGGTRSLTNINTPEEYHAALREIFQSDGEQACSENGRSPLEEPRLTGEGRL